MNFIFKISPNLIKLSKFSTMPIETAQKPLIKAFFYGTLKRDEPNYDHLLSINATFLSEAVTVEKYPLIIASEFNIPFLLNKKGYGKVGVIHIDYNFPIFICKECPWRVVFD